MRIEELVDVVKAAKAAKDKERDAIFRFVDDVVKEHGLLGGDEFWAELDRLAGLVRNYRDFHERTDWSRGATNEFFRAAIYGDRDGNDEENLIRCLRFVATYEDKVAKIYKALDRIDEDGIHEFGMGDDGFGDMCDSFPLHGRGAYEALMEDEEIPEKPALGENYVAMNLDKAAEEWVRNCVEESRLMPSERD